MASSLSWLDFSEKERRQILDVLDLFREQNTRDELGLGVIRDAFADLFFPGTSTIQTRARYFLFVAWLYRDLEKNKTPAAKITAVARREEVKLINALSETEGDSNGVIGYRAREHLQRLPSNVYWVGLQRWDICRYHGNQTGYHASVDRFYRAQDARLRETEEDDVQPHLSYWHPDLPPVPDDFPDQAEFCLTAAEARFLQDRILLSAPNSLLAHWVQGPRHEWVRYLWEYPEVEALPVALQELVEHARLFSLVIAGAPLLYNLMLAEKCEGLYGEDELVIRYQNDLEDWAAEVESEAEAIGQWDRSQFLHIVLKVNPRLPIPAREFISQWIDLASQQASTISESKEARRLIEWREVLLKGAQARLRSEVALQTWQGAAGVGRLTYRWEIAQTILQDILGALDNA